MISLTRPRAFKAGTEHLAKARELDAVAPHDLGFAKRETIAKPDRARLAQKKLDCGLGRKRSVLGVKPEGSSEVRQDHRV